MDRWSNVCDVSGCSEYDDDILETLKESEANRKQLKFIAPQMQHRPLMVQLIQDVCEEQRFRRTTVHLAIYLLDIFMSCHAIPERRLKLVALTCLFVACKLEDNESNVPTLSTLNGFVGNIYEPSEFVNLEVRMLKFFNWDLTIPSAATFLDLFELHSLSRNEYAAFASHPETPQNCFTTYVRCINRTAGELLSASLGHFKLCRIKPSQLAASCIAVGRILTQNVPVWSEQLTSLTGYTYSQLHVLCEQLIFDDRARSPATSPKRSISDAGYLSEWDDDSSSSCYTSSASDVEADDESDTSSVDSIGKIYSENRRRRAYVLCRDSGASSSEADERGGKRCKVSDNEWP